MQRMYLETLTAKQYITLTLIATTHRPESWKLNGNIFFELFLSDLDK